LPTPRHTLISLLPDGVPPGRRDLCLLQRRRRYAPSRTVRTYAEEEPLLHLGRAPSAPPQRAPSGGSFQCLTPNWSKSSVSRDNYLLVFKTSMFPIFSLRINYSCKVLSAFRDRGVPKPTSEMSPRAPAQMGRREAEREGGK
jgi:hypothetical protein